MRHISSSWRAVTAAFFALMVFSGPVFADALDDYRRAGHIIERADGLVEAASGAPPAARALVERVNAQRRDLYQQRAAQQGVSVNDVAVIYAQQIRASAPRGTLFREANGRVVRK